MMNILKLLPNLTPARGWFIIFSTKKRKNIFGFKPYVRKTYQTSKKFSTENGTSIFKISNRKEYENNLIKTIEKFNKKIK